MANPSSLKPFKKGSDERRNLKGRPKLPDLADLIIEEVGDKGYREVITALLKQAKKGNVKAIQEILDRGYGKAPQRHDHEGEVNLNVNDARNALLAKLSKEQE